MDADSSSPGWLLFLAQLPSRPSSARVALWRRLRAAGATTMVNSAWVLPETDGHASFFEQLREVILGQGGTAFILNIPDSAPEVDEAIVQRFRGDRAREYDEFIERCTAFLDEISKETRAGKYTFAEMEEGEQDLEKLARWLAKIRERDFFPDEHRQQSATMLARCRSVLDGFSQAVYIAEGVQEADGATPDQAPRRPRPGPTPLGCAAPGRLLRPGHPSGCLTRCRCVSFRGRQHKARGFSPETKTKRRAALEKAPKGQQRGTGP